MMNTASPALTALPVALCLARLAMLVARPSSSRRATLFIRDAAGARREAGRESERRFDLGSGGDLVSPPVTPAGA